MQMAAFNDLTPGAHHQSDHAGMGRACMFVCPGELCRRAAIVCMQACASSAGWHGLACTRRMHAGMHPLQGCACGPACCHRAPKCFIKAGRAAAACAELDTWGLGLVCAPSAMHQVPYFKCHALLPLHSNLHILRTGMHPTHTTTLCQGSQAEHACQHCASRSCWPLSDCTTHG
jgi:hypothetical protein